MPLAHLGLPRCRRLYKPSEFRAATRGDRLRDRYFGLYGCTNGKAHARLGVSVSRRVSLKAVERNRIKRQIRESFRVHQNALRGIDVVVVAFAPAGQAPNVELRQSLQQHWEKIAYLCKPS